MGMISNTSTISINYLYILYCFEHTCIILSNNNYKKYASIHKIFLILIRTRDTITKKNDRYVRGQSFIKAVI